jgi:hypothetical protein
MLVVPVAAIWWILTAIWCTVGLGTMIIVMALN